MVRHRVVDLDREEGAMPRVVGKRGSRWQTLAAAIVILIVVVVIVLWATNII